MSSRVEKHSTVTVILGAGASRSVSYADEMSILSPLDSDFFDLLQRLEISGNAKWHPAFQKARESILEAVVQSGDGLWKSMERMFYTLHLTAVLEHKLLPSEWKNDPAKKLIDDFAKVILGLLRTAHGKRSCENHQRLLQRLHMGDSILTFNYDLVAERSLKAICGKQIRFGKWSYGLERPPERADTPILHKLHGSVGWKLIHKDKTDHDRLELRYKSWSDLDRAPGYLAGGPTLPLLLPYWEKRVEKSPWCDIWARAAQKLLESNLLVIWGYSLPVTDLKARELFRLVLRRKHAIKNVCVIDPSQETRDRWRALFLGQRFWAFEDINKLFDFLEAQQCSNAIGFGPLGRW